MVTPGQNQGSELSSASVAAMTKAQRTSLSRTELLAQGSAQQGRTCKHPPWPFSLTQPRERGRENHYLQTDIPPCPWTPGPAQAGHLQPFSYLHVEPKTLWSPAADEDHCHVKERLNSHEPENLCSGVLTPNPWKQLVYSAGTRLLSKLAFLLGALGNI